MRPTYHALMRSKFMEYLISWVHGVVIGGGVALIVMDCAGGHPTMVTILGASVIGNSITYFAVVRRRNNGG